MKFPNLRYGNFYRPIVPVTFVVDERSLSYEALLDTGADYSVVDRKLGVELGVQFDRAVPVEVVGIAGKYELQIVPNRGIR